jgi:drug/metabolite transporter (DMT)-like permease
VLGWLLITTSLPRLPAALTSLLLTVQPVGSVALAAVIFGESPSAIQLLGVVLVLTALITATWSRRAQTDRTIATEHDVDPTSSEAEHQDVVLD